VIPEIYGQHILESFMPFFFVIIDVLVTIHIVGGTFWTNTA
jgi:hypothetical protein